jgi:hypothetical protein
VRIERANPASVLKVGDGRGFIIEHRVKLPPLPVHLQTRRLSRIARHRLVITAAHCLPQLPPATPASHCYERTYKGLLGNIEGSKKSVWAECLFADPVADIAVLGCPDNQELFDEANAYDALVDGIPTLQIGKARNGSGWLLALSGNQWVRTALKIFKGIGGTSLETGPTESGMSGSPILNDAGRAVGVVSIGSEAEMDGKFRNERAGPQPILSLNLPGWMLSR